MGVRDGRRAADRHRGGQPHGRGRRRDHSTDPQGPPRRRRVPGRGMLRRGDAGGAGRVRGRAAPQRGRPVVMSRRGWAAAILGAWAVSLGWLVKREFFPPTGARLAEAALSVPPGAVYCRLGVAGKQVGFASSTIDTLGTGIRVTDILVLQVPVLGTLPRTTALSRATLSRTLRFEGVDAKFDGDLGRFAARGLVNGDTVLTVSLASGTDSETSRVPLARSIILPTILPLRLAFGGELKRGKTYTIAVFDPMLLAQQAVDVTVAAESTLVLPDSARFGSTGRASPGRDRRRLWRVGLSGRAPAGPDFTTGRQRLTGDTLVVRRQTGAELTARYRLPAREPRLTRFLAPEPLIQSEDARIQAQARLILGREQDPARAARLIHDWVSAHVERRVAAGTPGLVRLIGSLKLEVL